MIRVEGEGLWWMLGGIYPDGEPSLKPQETGQRLKYTVKGQASKPIYALESKFPWWNLVFGHDGSITGGLDPD